MTLLILVILSPSEKFRKRELITLVDNEGCTALDLARLKRHDDLAEIICEYQNTACFGLKYNYQDTKPGRRNSSTSVSTAQLLIQNGANINAAGEHGETAFWWACYSNQLTTARLLIDHGANIQVTRHPTASVVYMPAATANVSITALECLKCPFYATPKEKYWRRRKSFAFFLQSLKVWPKSQPQWAQQRVLAELPDLQRLIGSFL